jgi:pyruvate-formate lyase-activating enzyme
MYLLYATPDGDIGELRSLRPIDDHGRPLGEEDMIPLPEGATVAMMPGRLATGMDRHGQQVTVPAQQGWALSAFLPIGYTRTHIPGYTLAPQDQIPSGAATLPFFGYSAVAGKSGQMYVAAMQTDDPTRWHPDMYDLALLRRQVKRRLRAEPENRVLQHHAHCALDYRCPTASNLFFERWEGAVAVAGGCNARCIGCISKQDEDGLISPQDRLTFVPSVEEIVRVGVAHLNRDSDAIFSFGQGCEGEPLMQWRVIERAIRGMRELTDSGTININTNASNPAAMERLCAAGLDAMRASTISARPATYDAYYRPIGYGLEQVKRSLIVAREAGIYTSINLLLYPGLADAEDEAAAWVDFLRETGTRLVQLRNLNIDPELLEPRLPPHGPALGVRAFVDLLRRELPDVRVGNFSVPVRRTESGAREPILPELGSFAAP